MNQAIKFLAILTILFGIVSISVTFFKTVVEDNYEVVNLSEAGD